MKILQKGFTNNEFSIQLEDWIEDFPSLKCRFCIGAYLRGNWKNRVRCQCDFTDKSEAEKVFEQLLLGNKTVFDYAFTIMEYGGKRISIKEAKLERTI